MPQQIKHCELTTELWKKIVLDIKSCIGSYFIRFCGGEPFCRADLLELIDFGYRNDIYSLITTNGTFINNNIAKELQRKRVVLMQISLDGFKAKTHDSLRGVEGTYQKVMTAIQSLQGRVPIQVNTTIMNDNLDEILDLTEFTDKNKIRISFQGLINISSREAFLSQKEDYLFPKDFKKIDYIIDELLQRKRYNKSIVNSCAQLNRLRLYYSHSANLNKRRCEAFCAHLVIKPKGDLFLCTFLQPIGNLAQDSLNRIWKSDETFHKIREMRRCKIRHCLIMRGCHRESYGEIINKFRRAIFNPPKGK